jgi:hypothetical protein
MADTTKDKVHVVNRAFLKLGLPATFSIDAETAEGGIVDLVWPGLEATVATKYSWASSVVTRKLIRHSVAPENGFTYSFEMPGDMVGPPLSVLSSVVPPGAKLRDYAIEAVGLCAHEPEVWLRCKALIDPRYWSEAFREAFATALASRLAVPMRQDEAEEKRLAELAFGRMEQNGGGGLFGDLNAIHMAAQPQGRGFYANDPLTRARFA